MKKVRDVRDFVKQWQSDVIFRSLMPSTLQTKFEKGEESDLTDVEVSFLQDVIPEDYLTNYVHFNGLFYLIDYESKKLKLIDFESINNKQIFDASRSSVYSLLSRIDAAVSLMKVDLEDYESTALYNPRNYTFEKKAPVSQYDSSFSIKREQSENMRKWQDAHIKKYHKKGFGYRGASPTSVFEIRMGSCSLGTYADCVCTSCLEKADNAEKVNDVKNAEKIRKNAKFEVFNNL